MSQVVASISCIGMGDGGRACRRCSKRQAPTQPEDLPRNRRYDVDFWGVAGGRRKPGRKNAGAAVAAADEGLLAETQRNNQKDLQRCRELLVGLDEEEPRSRLVASRWNDGGEVCVEALVAAMASGWASGDRWLREAAAAFNVETNRDHRRLRQEPVAEAAVIAVRRARPDLRQSASASDGKRRMLLRAGPKSTNPKELSVMTGACMATGINRPIVINMLVVGIIILGLFGGEC